MPRLACRVCFAAFELLCGAYRYIQVSLLCSPPYLYPFVLGEGVASTDMSLFL